MQQHIYIETGRACFVPDNGRKCQVMHLGVRVATASRQLRHDTTDTFVSGVVYIVSFIDSFVLRHLLLGNRRTHETRGIKKK